MSRPMSQAHVRVPLKARDTDGPTGHVLPDGTDANEEDRHAIAERLEAEGRQ